MFAVTDTADVTTSKSADMAVPELRQNLILPTLLAPEALPATVLPSRSARERRHAKYARRLIFSDGGVIICLSIFSAQILRFWDQPVPVSSPWAWSAGFGYTLVSCYWQCCGWDSSPWGGADQPRWPAEASRNTRCWLPPRCSSSDWLRSRRCSFTSTCLAATWRSPFPLGLTGLVVNRWGGWRHYTARIRRRGMDQDRLLIVGTAVSAHDVATEFAKDPWAGYQIVGGICTPEGPTEADASISVGGQPIPVVGMSQAILDAVQRTGVHTVALAATHGLRPVDVRRLMWELDALQVDLMLAPGMIDIADRRLHSRPVAGMAMFEIVKPQYSRANSLIKRSFDIVFALVALLLVSPVMVATALAVRLTSRGPTFYRSERIGMDGAPFRMTKFRSMFVDAESRMPALIAANGGNALFFKMKDDPRVTRVGRLIRKFSIDELPQFFDVLRGTMSVVGPRPQVRREVDSYDDLVSRRLTVKPGLTGLWQISGRSDLAVEDAIRLDLTYVENWSLYRDLIIIVKTVRTVLLGSGAY